MKKITCILSLLLLVFTSCNSEKNSGTVASRPAQTFALNYKNTAIPLDSLLLRTKPEEIKTAYKKAGFNTIWNDKADRDSLLVAIKEVASDGLFPEDYNLAALAEYELSPDLSTEESIRYDLLLTETFTKLSTHLFLGKVSPSDVYPDWDLKQKDLDVNKLLTEALENHSIRETLNKCRPQHEIYSSLRNSLKYISTFPDDKNHDKIDFTSMISPADADSIVIPQIRKRLLYWKDITLADSTNVVYDSELHSAIKKFQLRHGLPPHGKIDSTTVAELNISRDERRRQIMVNLERWRWFPYSLGDKSLLINIPDYNLAVLDKNDTVQVYKVIVGRPERRTPVLQSSFYSIVINPTWTVPPTIIKEDLTPGALQDPDYFSKHNMTIYDNKNRRVDPYAWDFERANGYRYVQGPGPDNSLGEIKFNFGNKRNVYLHDTNHREQFKNRFRSLSSGCVRVENPVKLAAYMLKDDKRNKLSETQIKEMIVRRQTITVNMTKSIHVHQLYWTAWMDRNGLQFRQDIYNLDNALYNKLTTQTVEKPAYSSLMDDK